MMLETETKERAEDSVQNPAQELASLRAEVLQLRERNETYSATAHHATHENEGLLKKYRILEKDRNMLANELREKDIYIKTLEIRLKKYEKK